jgi:hypothetical protein
MHDYDIVEGPVVDDRIQRNIDAFSEGRISREKFLEMLRFPHYEPEFGIRISPLGLAYQ